MKAKGSISFQIRLISPQKPAKIRFKNREWGCNSMLNITEDLLSQYIDYMHECVAIAKRAANPPYIGCLILNKDGKKVSEGWRHFIEGCYLVAHPERDAIQKAREPVKGGTLITTLEPCRTQRNMD